MQCIWSPHQSLCQGGWSTAPLLLAVLLIRSLVSVSSLIRASRSDQSARVGSVPWHGDTASVLSPASGTPESCLCTAPHKKNLCWEGGPPAPGAAASLFWMDPWLMGSGGGTLVPHLGTAVHCPYSPAQSALQCPLPCPAALLPCSPPAARGACGPQSQQMALFGSAVPESLGITSRLCRP